MKSNKPLFPDDKEMHYPLSTPIQLYSPNELLKNLNSSEQQIKLELK